MISQELRVTDKVEPDTSEADKRRIKLSYPKFSAQFTLQASVLTCIWDYDRSLQQTFFPFISN